MVQMNKYRKKQKSAKEIIEFWDVDLAFKSIKIKTQISP